MTSVLANQIQNRNFLSPIGFKFTLAKEPKVTFFSNSTRIPDINLGTAIQSSYLKDIDVPGDKVLYGDFYLKFLVDENMENYMKVHNWITGLGYPESTEQYADLIRNNDGTLNTKNAFSDGNLEILNSNYRSVANIKFKDLFPISLSSLDFEASNTDVQYLTAEVTFKYTIYDILGTDGNPL